MFNILKFFFSIFTTYKKDALPIIFYEIFFFIKYLNSSKKIFYNVIFEKKVIYKNVNSTIPCPLYYALLLARFINKKKIKSVLDLGSGYGRLTNFLDYNTKAKIHGYELLKDIYKKSVLIKNKNVVLKNRNILELKNDIQGIECFVFSDPLKYKKDLEKVVRKIKKIKKKKNYYIIFINIDNLKSKIIAKQNLIYKYNSSKYKSLKFYKIN